jgi:DNA-binding IclR family transcriptional regulator
MMQAAQLERCFTQGQPLTPKRDAKLAQARTLMMLKDLAAKARLSPIAVHRYLVSYRRIGLVRQDANTKAYDLGQFAIELGVSALGRSNFLAAAREMQRELRDHLDESVMIAVWGSHGPVITSVEESSKLVVLTMRVGATLLLFRTATGWIFAAFMPHTILKPIMRAEIAAGRGPIERLGKSGIEKRLAEVRSAHLAFHSGHLLPGITAVATPLLDSRGVLVAVMSIFDSSEQFDSSPAGTAAKLLKNSASRFATFAT